LKYNNSLEELAAENDVSFLCFFFEKTEKIPEMQ